MRVAVGAALDEQRLAGGAPGGIDRPKNRLRPGRRLELSQQLFQPIEIGRVRTRRIAIDWKAPQLDVGKDADHLADIAPQRADIVGRPDQLALRDAVPLHPVELMDVPQERIAHRRIRRVARLAIRLGQRHDLVEDEAECVEPREPVAQRRGVRLLELLLPRHVALQLAFQHRPVVLRVGAPEHRLGEAILLFGVVARLHQGAVEVIDEALRIGERRAAIDPHPLALVGDLRGVTGRAVQAHPGLAARLVLLPAQVRDAEIAVVLGVDGEPDRQSPGPRRGVRQVAEALDMARSRKSRFEPGCSSARNQASGSSRDPCVSVYHSTFWRVDQP